MRNLNLAAVAGATLVVGSTCAMADGLFANGTFTIGAGAYYSSGIYKAEKSKTSALPFVAYDSDRLHLSFEGIAYKLVNREDLEFALRVAPGETPSFPERNPLFSGLKRGTPIETGFDTLYRFDSFYVSGGAMVDVSSEHDGYQAEAKIGTELQMGSIGIDAGAGVRLRDSKLNDFLYGVSTTEANAARVAYKVGRTIEPFVSMTMSYAVTDRTALVGIVDYQFVDKDIRNSPLTRDNDRYGVGLGLLYNF